MIWGPDNKLWITERQGKHVSTVDPKTGEHKILYTFENAFSTPPHEGVLGIALDGNSVYVAYTYKTEDEKEYARIVHLDYNKQLGKLENETIVIDKLAGSNDHNSGRLLLGKDGKIIEWRNSLLISTLKNGALYRVPLNSDQSDVQGDVTKYFKTNNRYRKVLVSPDTTKIFIATDNVGMGIGLDEKPNKEMANKGAIIIFEYK